uniref:Protein kinase domain-containing protein n=1 Tax=Fagus sylvatica TaxID=28930 RepID=A0A2N9HYD6_FAGSY
MMSMLEKPLSNCIVLFRVLFTTVNIIILVLASSSQLAISSSLAAPSPSMATMMRQEAEALLEWKASLDNQSQFLLSSWNGNIPCNWVGIACNKFSSISHINLPAFGLKGTLHNFSFSSFPSLTILNLSNNLFFDTIPSHLANLSKLIHLDLSANQLSGKIPSICQLTSLRSLSLRRNILTGTIPTSIRNSSNLAKLNVSDNKLSGSIFPEIGMLGSLTMLSLFVNNLSGVIPPQLGRSTQLQKLDLSFNNLFGQIPKELGSLTSLFHLDLGDNKLSGSIPREIGMLSKLQYLILSSNNLTGVIPQQIQGENFLIGNIPPQLGELRNLETLNLSHNELFGLIPSTFGEMSSLITIDISYNRLEGPLPNNKAFYESPFGALRNNKGLCGNSSSLKACPSLINWSNNPGEKKRNKVVIIFIVPILGTMFLSLIVFGILYPLLKRSRLRNNLNNQREAQNSNIFAVWSYDGKMVYESFIEATEEFDCKHCVGVGGCGSVYKAKLQADLVFAVKKLHSVHDGGIDNAKALENEVRALLKEKLSNKEEAVNFDWIGRENVVRGVANALSYMHHDCSPPIVHRDISSKNILLDLEYEAHISDFDTARLLKPDSSNWTLFAGTFGYTAPGNSSLPISMLISK